MSETTAVSEAEASAARSGLYSLLAKALAVPDEDLHCAARNGSLAAALSDLVKGLPFGLAADGPPEVPDFVEFQSDYIAFFELGKKSPPCPLYEGAIRGDQPRKALMEELIRFYHHFGLGMSQEGKELPDQLSVELEFMHYLSFLETELRQKGRGGEDVGGIMLAQRDFLSRHLAAWVPDIDKRAQRGGPAFHRTMLGVLGRFVAADLAYLEAKAA